MVSPRVYHIPRFPLQVALWHDIPAPPVGSPDLVFNGQLRWLNRGALTIVSFGIPGDFLTRALYVPKGTDIRPSISALRPDQVEVPRGSRRFYAVADVDDIAKGFPNEFRCAVLIQNVVPPVPLP